ncbi:UNVERIFIED_CONTAM: hypothetical protein NCL1_29654 [Trichonephila clavipes]
MSNEHNYNILAQSYMRPASIFLVTSICMLSLNGVKNIATSKLKMAKLPAMKYSAPTQDEVCELDFGDCTDASVRRKTKYDDYDYDEKSTSRWDYLPDILLEDIFSRLTIRERYYASQVSMYYY